MKINIYKLWHERLGHISKTKFLELKSKNLVPDVDIILNVQPSEGLCKARIKGKQTGLPFLKAKGKEYIKRPLFIVHTDVCGPITPTTIDNKNYFVTFIDEFQSKYSKVICISYSQTPNRRRS